MMPIPVYSPNGAFLLSEPPVATAIVAMLVGMLFPAPRQAKAKAKRIGRLNSPKHVSRRRTLGARDGDLQSNWPACMAHTNPANATTVLRITGGAPPHHACSSRTGVVI